MARICGQMLAQFIPLWLSLYWGYHCGGSIGEKCYGSQECHVKSFEDFKQSPRAAKKEIN
jgi:hypothetical protein